MGEGRVSRNRNTSRLRSGVGWEGGGKHRRNQPPTEPSKTCTGNSNVSENETLKDGLENERAERAGAKLHG